MANKLGIVGKSGSGKTSSLFKANFFGEEHIGLDPKETVIFSPTNKELPIKGGLKLYPQKKLSEGGRYFTNLSPETMVSTMIIIDKDYTDIKNIIIDDAQYLQSLFLMDKAEEKGYDKFTQTALRAYLPIKAVNNLKRNDLNVIFIYHSETDDTTKTQQIKTSGKMVETTLGGLDGLFTTLLYSECKMDFVQNKIVYIFHTRNNGNNTCKSPMGMFEKETIPNDLGLVVATMKEYYS